jgi:hypothetical protein
MAKPAVGPQEEDAYVVEADPDVAAQLYRMAHGSTGLDPYDFVRILYSQQRLPEGVDINTMVIPEMWGKGN